MAKRKGLGLLVKLKELPELCAKCKKPMKKWESDESDNCGACDNPPKPLCACGDRLCHRYDKCPWVLIDGWLISKKPTPLLESFM